MVDPRYACYLRDGLTCRAALASIGAGTYFFTQTQGVIGGLILALRPKKPAAAT